MSRRARQRVPVRATAAGAPQALRWRDRWVPVERVLEAWVYAEPWWEGGGERSAFRVLAGGRVLELVRDAAGDWWLHRFFD